MDKINNWKGENAGIENSGEYIIIRLGSQTAVKNTTNSGYFKLIATGIK